MSNLYIASCHLNHNLYNNILILSRNEAIQTSGVNSNKNSVDMENHVFSKARNKDEYLSFVARLIIHVREMSK